MYLSLLLLALFSGPLLYVLVALGERKPDTYEDYHISGRTIPQTHFVGTTVAYAWQVAALALFASWGWKYGFWTILVPAFWALGYYIIAFLVRSGRLDTFLFQDSIGTIHQFIASKGNLKLVGILAAFASLIGITGPAMYEANLSGDVVARLIAAHLGHSGDDSVLSLHGAGFFAIFLASAAAYMLRGGFRTVVSTDVYQLAIGYVAVSFVMSALLWQLARVGEFVPAFVILLLLTIISAWLLWYWHPPSKSKHTLFGLSASSTPLAIGASAYLTTLMLIVALPSSGKAAALSAGTWMHFVEQQRLHQPFAMGGWALLSLLIANALYQLVDVGQWQRLAAVQYDPNNKEELRRTLVRANKVVTLYSPSTWVVAMFFGMMLRYLVPEVNDSNYYNALRLFLLHYQSIGGWFANTIVLVFLVGMIAVMLSTVDSLVSCLAFTLHNDCVVPFRPKWRTTIVAEVMTGAYLVGGFLLYLEGTRLVSNLADILYSCWSAQIGLLPAIMIAFYRRNTSGAAMSLSILGGLAGAVAPLIVRKLTGLPWDPYRFAPPLALLGSTLFMLLGLGIVRLAGRSKPVDVREQI